MFYPADDYGNVVPGAKGYASRESCMDAEGIGQLRPLHTIGRTPEHANPAVEQRVAIVAAATADAGGDTPPAEDTPPSDEQPPA